MSAMNAHQTDALTELINIAFGLTAAKLSQIAGCRVLLDVPIIGIHPIDALAVELRSFVTGPAVSVHQVFSGPISGDAILFMNHEGAVSLSSLLVEEQPVSQSLDPFRGETLTEIGNMLLGACLGVFGNLLEVRVTFSIPQLHVESLEQFLKSLTVGGDALRHAIIIAASFRIREQGVDGRLVLVLGISSLDRLVQAVERWEGSQIEHAT